MRLGRSLVCGAVATAMAWTLAACAEPRLRMMSRDDAASGRSRAGGAAADGAIWADPNDPSRGLILAAQAGRGLEVFDLAGRSLRTLSDAPVRGVDLRDSFTVRGRAQVLIGAAEPGALSFYLLDPHDLTTRFAARAPVDELEPGGFCMGRLRGETVAVIVGGNGYVRQFAVGETGGEVKIRPTREFELGGPGAGCVVDDKTGLLYIADSSAGVWHFPLNPIGAAKHLMAPAPSDILKPMVGGLTLLRDGERTYLIASSHGGDTLVFWRVDGHEPIHVGRLPTTAPSLRPAGVAALGGRAGPHADGLIVLGGEAGRLKLLDWRELRSALRLR